MNYPYYMPSGAPTSPYGAFSAPRYEVTRVNGKNGAEAFQMAPNSQVLLLDETAPVVWLKTTDGAGYPTLMPYDISPAKTQEQKEAGRLEAIEKRIADLEVLVNAKSNSRSSKSKQADESGSAD